MSSFQTNDGGWDDAIQPLKSIIVDLKGHIVAFNDLPEPVQQSIAPEAGKTGRFLNDLKNLINEQSPVEERVAVSRLLFLMIYEAKKAQLLPESEVFQVWDYLVQQALTDYQTLRYTLVAMLLLVRDPSLRKSFPTNQYLSVVVHLLTHVTLASLQQIARRYYLELLKLIFETHIDIFSASKPNGDYQSETPTGTVLLEAYITAVAEEVDPDNLLLVFSTLADVLIPHMPPQDVHTSATSIFGLITSYFPIRFEVSGNASKRISGEKLKASLRRVFASSLDLAPYVIPFLVDKLGSAVDEPTQIDVLLTLSSCIRAFGGAGLLALKNWPLGARVSAHSRASRERWPRLVPLTHAPELVRPQRLSERQSDGCCGGSKGGSNGGGGGGGGGCCGGNNNSAKTTVATQPTVTETRGGGCGGACACKSKDASTPSQCETKKELAPVNPRLHAAIEAFTNSTIASGFVDQTSTTIAAQARRVDHAAMNAPKALIANTEEDDDDDNAGREEEDMDVPEPFELIELWEALKRVALTVSSASGDFHAADILKMSSQAIAEGPKGVWIASCACIREVVKAVCPDTIPGTVYRDADTFVAPALADCLSELRIADAKLARAHGRILAVSLLGASSNASAYLLPYVRTAIAMKLESGFLPRSQLLAVLELAQNIVQGTSFILDNMVSSEVRCNHCFEIIRDAMIEFYVFGLKEWLRHSPAMFHSRESVSSVEHDEEVAKRGSSIVQNLLQFPFAKLNPNCKGFPSTLVQLTARLSLCFCEGKVLEKPLDYFTTEIPKMLIDSEIAKEVIENAQKTVAFDHLNVVNSGANADLYEDSVDSNALGNLVSLAKAASADLSSHAILPVVNEVMQHGLETLSGLSSQFADFTPGSSKEAHFLRTLKIMSELGCTAPQIMLPTLLPYASRITVSCIQLVLESENITSGLQSAIRVSGLMISMLSEVVDSHSSLNQANTLDTDSKPDSNLLDFIASPLLDVLCKLVTSSITERIPLTILSELFKSAAQFYHSFIASSITPTQVTFLTRISTMLGSSNDATTEPFKLCVLSSKNEPRGDFNALIPQISTELSETVFTPIGCSLARLLQPLICASFAAASSNSVSALCESGIFERVVRTLMCYALSVPSAKTFEAQTGVMTEIHELAPIRHALTAAVLQLPANSELLKVLVHDVPEALCRVALMDFNSQSDSHMGTSMFKDLPQWTYSIHRQSAADVLSSLARGFALRGHSGASVYVHSMLKLTSSLLLGLQNVGEDQLTRNNVITLNESLCIAARIAVNIGVLASPHDSLATSPPIRFASVEDALKKSLSNSATEIFKDSPIFARRISTFLERELVYYLAPFGQGEMWSGSASRIYAGCKFAPFAAQRHFETTLPSILSFVEGESQKSQPASSGNEVCRLYDNASSACASIALGHLLSRTSVKIYAARLSKLARASKSSGINDEARSSLGLLPIMCSIMESALKPPVVQNNALYTPSALTRVLTQSAGDVACIWIAEIIGAYERAEAELAQYRGNSDANGSEASTEQRMRQADAALVSEQTQTSLTAHTGTLIRYALSRVSELQKADSATNEGLSKVNPALIAVFVILRKLSTMPLDITAPFLQVVRKTLDTLLDQPNRHLRREIVSTKNAWYAASVKAVRG